MSELIEMPYGNGKALALEFIKAYTEVQLDVEIDSRKKIYKNKCRYCGGDLEMYTHEDRNNVGKEGFTTSLTCRGCAGHLFEFSFNEEDIPNAEKRLLERYGIK